MTRKPTITSRQKLFAELLVYETNTLSPAECAYKAGYTKRPRQAASELRNPKIYPLVAEYIRELELERKNKFSIDKAKSLQRYSQLSHGAESKNQYSAAIQAEILKKFQAENPPEVDPNAPQQGVPSPEAAPPAGAQVQDTQGSGGGQVGTGTAPIPGEQGFSGSTGQV